LLLHVLLLRDTHRVLAGATRTGQLRLAGTTRAGQLGLTAHGVVLLLLLLHVLLLLGVLRVLLLLRVLLVRGHRLRSRYGGGHRGRVARLGGLAHLRGLLMLLHPALLLVLRGSTSRCGQFGAQVLVLPEHSRQLRFDLVEEGVDLVLVIAFAEADGRELLVTNVLGGQRHLFTST
jgi:hypothetical protein